MKYIQAITTVLVGAMATVGCAAESVAEDASESADTVSETEDALASNCRCSGGLCYNCEVSNTRIAGPCSCPNGAVSCTIWNKFTPVDRNNNAYRWSEFTGWSGGGDVRACTRKQKEHSVTAFQVQTTCFNGGIYERTSIPPSRMVNRERGSVAGTFGNAGTCGLFEQWGPWTSWRAGY